MQCSFKLLHAHPCVLEGCVKFSNGTLPRSTHYINVCTSTNVGIFKSIKRSTCPLPIEQQHYMLKQVPTDNELISSQNIPLPNILPHYMLGDAKQLYLLRGPTTPYSLGDLCYALYLGDFDYIQEHINPDFVIDRERPTLDNATRDWLYQIFDFAYPRVIQIIDAIIHGNVNYKLTLDNLDMCGSLYDFDDYPTDGFNRPDDVISMMKEAWSYCRQPLPSCLLKYHPQLTEDDTYSALVHAPFIDKVVTLNNRLPLVSLRASHYFFDNAAGEFTHIYNPIYGTVTVDNDLIHQQDPTNTLSNLITVQGPLTTNCTPIISISDSVHFYNMLHPSNMQNKPSHYDMDCAVRLTDAGIDLSGVPNYFYYGPSRASVLSDFLYYEYQGTQWFDTNMLRSLFSFIMSQSQMYATSDELSYQSGKPRNSSMGHGITGWKQDKVYDAMGADFINTLYETAKQTPIPFCTKVTAKYALSMKARARTVASCSFTASTIFRFAHKPVTNKMVTAAQNNTGYCLIGVSKFHGRFNSFVQSRVGIVEDYSIFGSDYTKCDRTFPLALRALAAAIIYELGDHDHNNHLFFNELNAYMLDIVSVEDALANKPGGTSSGDATTAFSNTFYNFAVHYIVMFKTFLSQNTSDTIVIRTAAHYALTTGNFDMYNEMLTDMLATDYTLNFLSDDSFICSKPTAFPIFTLDNYPDKLQSVIHTKVDKKKSWQSTGQILEFCSSHIVNINGQYHFKPEKDRILAALIILNKIPDVDIFFMRFVALLAESAVYLRIEPTFWMSMYKVFMQYVNDFIVEAGVSPIPSQLIDVQFYEALVFDDVDSSPFYTYVGDFRCQKTMRTCYCCTNIAVGLCESCPVPLPLCSFCFYEHLLICDHYIAQDVSCECGSSDLRTLNLKITTQPTKHSYICSECPTPSMKLPIFCTYKRQIILPMFRTNTPTQSAVSAIEDVRKSPHLPKMLWKSEQTFQQNVARIAYESVSCSELSKEIVYHPFDVSTSKPGIAQLRMRDFTCSPTSYAYFYKLKPNGKYIPIGKATITPRSGDIFDIFQPNNLSPWNHATHLAIETYTATYPPLPTAPVNATFVLGPPGCGKTHYIATNFFSQATEVSPVIYCAPTHRLVKDMDASYTGVISKSPYNNREYRNPAYKCGDPFRLCFSTHNTLPKLVKATLVLDEVSLVSPHTLLELISKGFTKLVFVGDPFQLSAIFPGFVVNHTYEGFYVSHIVNHTLNLTTCYRCPQQILDIFKKPYVDVGIDLVTGNHNPGTATILTYDYLQVDVGIKKPELIRGLLLQYPNYSYITNYRSVVDAAKSYNITVDTIDSSQGTTNTNHLVIICGSTNFSKLINRFIVASSRSTTNLVICMLPSLYKYLNKIFAFDSVNNSTPIQPEPTPSMTMQTISTPPPVSSSVCCDIEFYHYNKQYYVGEISVLSNTLLTCQFGCTIDGRYMGPPTCNPHDDELYVPPRWRRLRKSYPLQSQHHANVDRLLRFMAKTTTGEIHLILYSASNDITSLKDYLFEPSTCDCGSPAVIEVTKTPFCRNCLPQHGLATRIVRPTFVDVQQERITLARSHERFCHVDHGRSHLASSDTLMTECIYYGQQDIQTTPQLVVSTDEFTFYLLPNPSHPLVRSFIYRGSRIYALTHDCTNLYYSKSQPLKLTIPAKFKIQHSTNYLAINGGCDGSRTCTRCYYLHLAFTEFVSQHRYAAYSFIDFRITFDFTQFTDTVNTFLRHSITFYPQFNAIQKALLLDIKTVDDNVFTANGRMFKMYDHNLVKSIIKASVAQSATIMPLDSVIHGLDIDYTVGCAVDNYPCKETTTIRTSDIILTTAKLPKGLCDHYYLLVYGPSPTNSIYAGHQIFDGLNTIIIVNAKDKAPYTLSCYIHDVAVDMPTTLFSTGRFYHTSPYPLLHNEDISDLNHHIFHGDFSDDSYNLGGVHHIMTLNSYTHKLNYLPTKPTSAALVSTGGRGHKISTLFDVHANQLSDAITSITSDVTTKSKVVSLTIDYQQVRCMYWTSPDGIGTFYPQAVNASTHHVPYYVEYPSILQQVDHQVKYDLSNYNKPPVGQTLPVNFHKYVQLCQLISDHVKLPMNSLIYHIGAAGTDSISPGDLVLQQFFNKDKLFSYDILPYTSPITQLDPSVKFKATLIISDCYSVEPQPKLLPLLIEKLVIGGSLLYKTTETFTIDSFALASQFKSVKFFTCAVNHSSSEVYVLFSIKTPVTQTTYVPSNYLTRLIPYRHDHILTPYAHAWNPDLHYRHTSGLQTSLMVIKHVIETRGDSTLGSLIFEAPTLPPVNTKIKQTPKPSPHCTIIVDGSPLQLPDFCTLLTTKSFTINCPNDQLLLRDMCSRLLANNYTISLTGNTTHTLSSLFRIGQSLQFYGNKAQKLQPRNVVNKFNNFLKATIIHQFSTDTILDLGSGSGQDLWKYFAAGVKNATFVEPSQLALTELVRRSKSVDINTTTILDTPTTMVLDITYDTIFSFYAMHYALSPDIYKQTVDNIMKYLNPKGKLILVVPNPNRLASIPSVGLDIRKTSPTSIWFKYQNYVDCEEPLIPADFLTYLSTHGTIDINQPFYDYVLANPNPYCEGMYTISSIHLTPDEKKFSQMYDLIVFTKL